MKNVLHQLQGEVERHSEKLESMWPLPFVAILALSVFGHMLSLAFFSSLALWPYSLFSMELWRLFTSPFVGHNVLVLAAAAASMYFGIRILTQVNDNVRLLKVFAITQLGTSLTLCALAYIMFAFFRSSYLLYDMPICGLSPVCAAVLVMIKQFLPDSIVLATPAGRVKYTHLPLNGCLVALLAALIGLVRLGAALEVIVGTQVAWTYLRFVAPHETDDIAGDPSDHFAWATLFPSAFRPFCTLVSKATFRTLVKLRICKRRQVRTVDVNRLLLDDRQQSLSSISIPSTPAQDEAARDAERRRQKALVALNERLKTHKREEPRIDWDDEEETVAAVKLHSPNAVSTQSSTSSVEAVTVVDVPPLT